MPANPLATVAAAAAKSEVAGGGKEEDEEEEGEEEEGGRERSLVDSIMKQRRPMNDGKTISKI